MKLLITGGAGFIGVNSAAHFANKGHDVVIFDNLSRVGSEKNLEWITGKCKLKFIKGDIRRFDDVKRVIRDSGPFDLVLHLAAQVAVTTSVTDPRDDFEINALGTFNLLEAVREHNPEAVMIYSSTNKVYGEMVDLEIVLNNGRYSYKETKNGVNESYNLDFHSPYGCSKGAADQYCRDYHRIYGLKTIVLRQSCIYGYRQFGIEDQGWVAWFSIATAFGKPVTIYGDGKQVRDVLFIDDLLKVFELTYENSDHLAGMVFNIGGGPQNTLSLQELIRQLQDLCGKTISVTFDDWRPGDQKIFVGDVSLAEEKIGWKPTVKPEKGVEKLFHWIIDNKSLFKEFVV